MPRKNGNKKFQKEAAKANPVRKIKKPKRKE